MDPWLDSLSEDWVSQRGSSSPTVSEPDSVSTAKTSDHSRGFRAVCRTKSTSTGSTVTIHQSWSGHQGHIRNGSGILTERDLNDSAGGPRPGYTKATSTRSDGATVETRGRRASSTLHSIDRRSTRRHLTVHQKSVSASPQKDRRALLTPEWRRRLLGRNPTCGDICDLFSPIGLEQMFRPPPLSPNRDQIPTEPLNLGQNMPSDFPASPKGNGAMEEVHAPERPMKGSSGDADTDQHDDNVRTPLLPEPPTKDKSPLNEVSTTHTPDLDREDSQGSELRQQESIPSGDGSISDSIKLRQLMGGHQPDHVHSEAPDRTYGSLNGTEDERNEDLTPILISRHNTADGGIDYAPSNFPGHHQQRVDEGTKPPDQIDNTFDSDVCPRSNWLKAEQITLGSIEMGSTQTYDLPSSPHVGKGGDVPDLDADNPITRRPSQLQNALLSPSSVGVTGSTHEALDPEARSESRPPIGAVIQPPNEHGNLVPVATDPAASTKTQSASEQKDVQGVVQPKSPGCALKLFDDYDTFTNDRLLQRMETLNEAAEDVEAEIQAHEGREPQIPSPRRRDRQRNRNVTVMFSSPVASQSFQFSAYNPVANVTGFSREVSLLDPENSLAEVIRELNAGPLPRNASSRHTSFGLPIRSSSFLASRHVSFGCTPLRRISPISGNGSTSAGVTRRARFGVRVSTPLHRRGPAPNTRGPTNRGSSVVTFHLSPLADFTVNQSEETLPLEISYLATRKGSHSGKGKRRSSSLAAKELVQKLTDKEPYEPYWEYIWRLDIAGGGLKQLHGLNQFCPRIEELNVSNNQIRQLAGAPSSLRQLQVSHNCLSSLTAWGHLQNLQYLDVSSNEIDSLQGFRYLVHLRELKADNNHISSLEGILGLNGLIKLDISRNAFEKLDFAGSNLGRLSELRASENRLLEVRGLCHLSMLGHLDLDDNILSSLGTEARTPLQKLRVLRLNGNNLKNLDISIFPKLRTLHLDKNPISRIDGLSSAEHLDCLSIRESSVNIQDTSVLDDCYEVRKLFLSGNMFSSLHFRMDFLNLHHLELATCGLQKLPPNFGRLLANLRTLNLNFNALKDIRPLVGVVRLSKLMLVGNRLIRLRRIAHTLACLPTLEDVDMRHNPLTLGFYPPAMRSRIPLCGNGEQLQKSDKDQAEQFTFPPADAGEDEVYRKRLDIDTRLRRRVYELVIGSRCESLRFLDGLDFDRWKAMEQDEIWDRMIGLGVLHETQEDVRGPEEMDATESNQLKRSNA